MSRTRIIRYESLVDGAYEQEGAKAFINNLLNNQIDFILFSEQSSKTRQQLCDNLADFGFPIIDSSSIYTTTMAALDWMSMKGDNHSLSYLGGIGIKSEIENYGFPIDHQEEFHAESGTIQNAGLHAHDPSGTQDFHSGYDFHAGSGSL